MKAMVPSFVEHQDAYVDGVLRVCEEHRCRSLIPAHDGSIEALRRRRADVDRTVGLAMAAEGALAIAVDKTRTLAFAETIGLRVPRGAFVTDAGQAGAAIDDVGLPIVVKPTRSWAQEAGLGRRLIAVVVSTRVEALAATERILREGVEVVLQEWLPGDREALSFFIARGQTWARFAQRADRTCPPLGGNSVLRESIPLPEDIAAGAERLVAELGLDGYSEVEFRRDADGRPALMEINPRLSASVEIAVRAGVPFPRLLHDWASGEALEAVSGYRTGIGMRWLGGDLSWLRSVLGQQPGPDIPSRRSAITAFAGDFVRPLAYDYVDWRDPRPGLVAASGAARRIPRLARRIRAARGGSGGFDTDAVVIGAGPYGLSVSAHLSGRGVRHEVFGETMQLWSKHMPAGMLLKSEGFASNLSDPGKEHTLERFCAENETDYAYAKIGSPIPVDTFERYGRWFQERAVPGLREARVERVRPISEGFELRLSGGEQMRTKQLVVASGMSACAYLPPSLRDLPAQAVTHTYEHREPSLARGAEVAIVGAGQSALEAAALMHEQGANVHVVSRAPKVQWLSKPDSQPSLRERWDRPRSGLGDGRGLWVYSNLPLAFFAAPYAKKLKHAFKALGPAGAWWLRPRIEDQVELLLEHTVTEARVENGGVRLALQSPSGTNELSVSHVLAGTGYKPDVGLLDFLDPAMRQAVMTAPDTPGTPMLDSGFQSSVPGLHFVGYMAGFSFGPVMRFVYGADFAASRVARRLAG
jgi:cation diffusion facilitator CzcD-associated flavoprotein CzcO/predicted ATP-grasp superfamily ATP-dependent carboligase